MLLNKKLLMVLLNILAVVLFLAFLTVSPLLRGPANFNQRKIDGLLFTYDTYYDTIVS